MLEFDVKRPETVPWDPHDPQNQVRYDAYVKAIDGYHATWKAKYFPPKSKAEKAMERIEIRRQFHGVSMLLVVYAGNPDAVWMSMNGSVPIYGPDFEDIQAAVEEARAYLRGKKDNTNIT